MTVMQALDISNGYFQLWYLYLKQQQIDYHDIQALAAFTPALEQVLQAPLDGYAPYRFFADLMQISQEYLQCPQLHFELAKLIRPEHFGVVGYMATRSESVVDALQHVIRFSRLVIDGHDVMPLQLIKTQDSLELTWPLHELKFALINELSIACMVHLARQIFPMQQFHLTQIAYAHPPQTALYHYQKFYDCPVLFKQECYRLVIHADSLDLKSAWADASLMQLLLKQAEDAIAAKPKSEHALQPIRHFIADYLRQHAQAPKIEHVADQLYMSRRSVQRYFNQHHTSFKQLLETERLKRCEQLLSEDMSLSELADQLGYSDQSALARAYKTATGQTLLSRKKQLKQIEMVQKKRPEDRFSI